MSKEEAKQSIQDFLNKLSLEEDTVKTRLSQDCIGLTLRVALNELDWQRYNMVRCTEQSDELQERFYIILLGLTRLIGLMLTLHETFSIPTIMIRRQRSPCREVLEEASHLGFIQHGRRMVEFVRSGIAKFIHISPDNFEFILPDNIEDAEALERTIEDHWKDEFLKHCKEFLKNTESGRNLTSEVSSLLEENVFVYAQHFMGYDADPLLDEYFFSRAWNELQVTSGYDSFNELKTFGGIPYLKYLLGAAYLNSLCLKHEAFCEVMVKKEPHILLEDILTISAEREPFVEDIMNALNICGLRFQNYTRTTLEEAWKIYEVLALTRRNVKLIDRPWALLPCIIEFSDSSVMKFCSGRANQMDFLLKSLRYFYPQDYNTHQQSREGSMQRALHSLLQENFEHVEIRGNTKLRDGSQELTDVDFIAIDTRYGEIFLFQLKHQDRHGGDIQAGFSKMTRFRKESLRWLSAVNQWISDAEEMDVRTTFRVPRHVKIKKIRRIVIARYHAHPLATADLDEDTAYANWIQFMNAVEFMKAKQGDFRTLGGLFKLLRQHIVGAETAYHYDMESVEYCLNNLKFTVRQEVCEQ